MVAENYQEYDTPKLGVFEIDTDVYNLNDSAPYGWVRKLEKRKIIGETDTCFIEQTCIFDGEFLPSGIHKSRFVRWDNLQLGLW